MQLATSLYNEHNIFIANNQFSTIFEQSETGKDDTIYWFCCFRTLFITYTFSIYLPLSSKNVFYNSCIALNMPKFRG